MRRPVGDRLLTAELAGAVQRLASRPRVYSVAAGAAELRQLAGSRPDLLAEVAGLIWGYHRHEAHSAEWARHERAVVMLLDAGADPEDVPRWFAAGWDRASQGQPSAPGRKT
jgi:hypothetical protein